MKNLKKVLAFVVVFAMMLSCSVSAATFPDVSEDASYAEAATILSSLGLMIGDDAGNFNPDKILTRAEATALIMRAKGLESAAAGAAGATQFTDVPATHWASGYINLAAQSKVVAGYGDGTFGPEDEVKYEQFVKMIVAALDYEPKANLYGGYPSGYLIIASQKDITKNAPGTAGQPAPRSLVAQILFNALDVGMMELTLDNQGVVTYHDGTDTLLDTYLYIDKYEGILTGVTYNTNNDGEIGANVTVTWKTTNGTDYVTVDQADTGAEIYLGYAVSAYVATDAVTGKAYLKAIAPSTGKNEVVTIDYTQLAASKLDSNSALTAARYYANDTDSTPVELPLAPSYTAVLNNGTDNGTVVSFIQQKDAAQNPEVPGKATFINNDMDDDYDYVFVSSYSVNDIVDSIDAVNGTITGKNDGELVDVEANRSIWTFVKNGEVVSFEDVAVGNVLSIQEGVKGTYKLYTVYVSDAVVEGAATEKRTDSAGKTWYTIGTDEYHDAEAGVRVGDEGKFYLNVDGKIIHKEAIRAGAGNYAYLLEAALNTQGIGSGAVELKFLTIDGEWKVVSVADRVAVQFGAAAATNYDSNTVANDATVDLGLYTLADTIVDDATASPAVAGTKVELTGYTNQLFQYEINSAGKISKIYIANSGVNDDEFSLDGSDATATYKASTNKLGSVYLGENTKVISIDTTELGNKKEDGVIIGSVSGIFRDDESYNVAFYDKDLEGYPEVVIVYNANPGIDAATHPLVLTKVVDATNEAGYTIKKYYGLQAGQEVQVDSVESGVVTTDTTNILSAAAAVGFATVDTDGDSNADQVKDYAVAAGDVVLFALDAKGAVEQFDVLMSAAVARAAASTATLTGTQDINGTFATTGTAGNGTAWANTFGYASKTLSNNRVVLNYEVAGTINYNEMILRGQDVNFYTVNLNRVDNTVVSTATIGAIATSNKADKDGSWVFVREYDDAPVAVVVYTYMNATDVDVATNSTAPNFGALADAQ